MSRLVRHEDRIDRAGDHLDEYPLEWIKTMEQDIEGLKVGAGVAQHAVETLEVSLCKPREEGANIHDRVE